jgi:hypothetical protein
MFIANNRRHLFSKKFPLYSHFIVKANERERPKSSSTVLYPFYFDLVEEKLKIQYFIESARTACLFSSFSREGFGAHFSYLAQHFSTLVAFSMEGGREGSFQMSFSFSLLMCSLKFKANNEKILFACRQHAALLRVLCFIFHRVSKLLRVLIIAVCCVGTVGGHFRLLHSGGEGGVNKKLTKKAKKHLLGSYLYS